MMKRTILLLTLIFVLAPINIVSAQTNNSATATTTIPVYDTVRVVVTDTVRVVVEQKPAPRIDTLTVSRTPAELDSLAAVWSTRDREQGDKSFFDRYSVVGREASMPKDSLYKKRLQDIVSPVHLPYNYIVRSYIEGYLSGKWSRMSETLAISKYYFPIIEEELHAAGLPIELRYLAVVESNLSIRAGSRAGAMGLWQIMPATGKGAGLEINSVVDERCDVVKSTRAACQLLKYLYKLYGDWSLAIAAYNCGAGNVNKAIASAGKTGKKRKTFWDIYDYLPNETRCYVPKFIGATYAFTYHKAHNIVPAKTPEYLATDTVTIKRTLHLGQVASTLNIPIQILRNLNPQYKIDIIPAARKSYSLRLPLQYISQFTLKEKEIYSKEKQYLKDYLNPANIQHSGTSSSTTSKSNTTSKSSTTSKNSTTSKSSSSSSSSYYTYVVKDGDMLGFIAQRNKCTVNDIMKWNKLTSTAIRPGQKLRIYKSQSKK